MSTVSGIGGTGLGGSSGFASAPQAKTGRLRLTRRGRGVLMAVAATPFIVGAFLFSALGDSPATATLEGSRVDFSFVTVESGQSLWQLAEQLAPRADPRDTIAELMTLNQLDSADVFAGQELALPAHLAS
jgi:LysM repeat protein